jgi:cell division septum initiation protein DivIVA
VTEIEHHIDEDLSDLDDLPQTDTEKLLRRVLDIIESARPVPLSTSAMINKDEVIALLEGAITHFPTEFRESRWLLKERNEFLTKSRSEAEEIIVRARARAERMVQRNEVVRAAEARARQIVEAAEADARRMRLEIEDFCDRKLGSFEIVLERTAKLVQQGREKLQLSTDRLNGAEYDPLDHDATNPGRSGAPAPADGLQGPEAGFFDQDQS